MIVAGPERVGSKTWFFLQVRPANSSDTPSEPGLLGPAVWKGPWGWASTAGAASDLIAPADPMCPARPVTLSTLQTMRGPRALVCFGRSELTLRAWIVENGGLGGFENDNDRPKWLNAAFAPGAHTFNSDDEQEVWDGKFLAWVNPASDITWPANHTWVEIIGHFDDPAATTCRKYGPPESQNTPSAWPFFDILACREHFVVTAVTPTTAP